MRLFGLIGYPLSHSFSKPYFTEKFKNEMIDDARYENFPIPDIKEFPRIINENPNLCGLNVTIPYKEQVIPYLNELDDSAAEMQAVNTIKINKQQDSKYLKGFNTDAYGFKDTLEPLLKPCHTHALILGTGGASKAVAFALKTLDIKYSFVSRKSSDKSNTYSYRELNKNILEKHLIIINTTPLGMEPNVETAPEIPYEAINNKHICYDLVYNPRETKFLQNGKEYGAVIKNGLDMLYRQAEKAWEIWNT